MRILRELGRRTLSTHPVAWGDAGPLFTENMLFSGKNHIDGHMESPKLAVVLHGLLGAGRNLRTFTTELFQNASKHSGTPWTAVLVDLRNHGKSSDLPGLTPPHTLQSAAQDVITTVHNNWPGRIDALIGHSLGGKVALEITSQLAEGAPLPQDGALMAPPRQVWCLDSVPGPIPEPVTGTSKEVLDVLRAVSEIPLPIPSREWLFEELNRRGHTSKSFQQWLGSNLKLKTKGEYVWTFNVQGADAMFESYRKNSYWNVLQSPPDDTEIHVVKAMKGGRWHKGDMEEELTKIARDSDRNRTHVHEMHHVGHWLHAEDPKGVAALMLPYILKLR